MTNHTSPNAKTLRAVALAAFALLGLSACDGTSPQPSAAVTAGSTTAAVSTATAGKTGISTASQPPTQNQTQNQTQTAPKSTAKPSTAKTTAGSGLPADCTTSQLKAVVSPLTRPINHVLLTVTNTGHAPCSLYYFPALRFDADQQAVTQSLEDSRPQSVVSIAPGASAYAAIGTSAADGSGGAGRVEKQVQVFLESRDQSGSLPGSLTLPLPANTYVDDKAFVTYWQSDLQSAVAW